MSEQLPPGYSVPVYRSLIKPLLVGGVPQNAAVLFVISGGLFFVGMFMLRQFLLYFIGLEIVLVVAYRFAVERCKTDPHYFAIWLQNRGPKRFVP